MTVGLNKVFRRLVLDVSTRVLVIVKYDGLVTEERLFVLEALGVFAIHSAADHVAGCFASTGNIMLENGVSALGINCKWNKWLKGWCQKLQP